jgi:lipopolysaccharide heptosyltransferase II
LGDVVQALPVLRLLKRHFPPSEIFWWVAADLAPLLEHDSDLSGTFLFRRRGWARPQYWGELRHTIQAVRAQKFDWVIDLQGLARSSVFGWLAGGGLTIGLEDWREGAPALYDLSVPRPSFTTHAVDWYLEVLRALHVPVHWNFDWMPGRPDQVHAFHSRWNVPAARWILINPGARWPNKRWPAEFFAEVVRQLARLRPDWQFAILGAASDSELAKVIAAADPKRCLDLTGRTSLPDLVEWIRQGELLLSNDTGPMHIAAALGKPVVSVFGPTEPRRTGPYGRSGGVLRADLPCAPCLKPTCHYERPLECLRVITPEQVIEKIRRILSLE